MQPNAATKRPKNMTQRWGNRITSGLLLVALLALLSGGAGLSPAAALPPTPTVRVLALGDVMLGRYVGLTIANHGDDFGYPLAALVPDLRAADLSLANLEGPLVADPPPYRPTVSDLETLPLIGDRRAAPALAAAGFGVLGLANNHALDAGPAGVAATRAALAQAGVLPVGAGAGPQAARAPQIRTIHGLRVAILARSAIPTNQHADALGAPATEQPALLDPTRPADLADLAADLAAARAGADVVILIMHWGVEYTTQVRDSQQRIAAVAVDAGVDLVIGAHPHVAQPVELRGSRPTLIAWSLGNAVFDQQWRPDLRQGLALDAEFDRQGLIRARARPLWRQTDQAALVPPDHPQAQAVIGRIWDASSPELQAHMVQYTEGDSTASGPTYTLRPALAYQRTTPPPPAPPLRADFDGDGRTDTAMLDAGHLTVVRGGEPGTVLWRTPDDWRVDAVSLVSPTQPDLAFTVWKPTAPTEIRARELRDAIRQHFFLFGWRRGAIRPVWNSSALPDPFTAFAFAPLGPPGATRLIALEGSYAAPDAPGVPTVWAWNGFGYSLEWRAATPARTLWGAGDWVLVR
jgi:poly-gamma-glutamate synthesis protein (capsule biosynthesis protein)